MIRSLVSAARPALAAAPSRCYRARPPPAFLPADPDEAEERKFNEDFGIIDKEPPQEPRAKHEAWIWLLDPYFKARARVSSKSRFKFLKFADFYPYRFISFSEPTSTTDSHQKRLLNGQC